MPEPLKLMFNTEWVERLSRELSNHSEFNSNQFIQAIFSDSWESLELKQRSKHIARTMFDVLPGDYLQKLNILMLTAPRFSGYTAVVFSDFVELYGLDYWEDSVKAMEIFTQSCTAEFAVRPFLIANFGKMMAQFELWSFSSNEHIKRLSSEGIRSRLPWAMGVPQLKKDPEKVLAILKNLVKDESEYVRRSVANNLNDISKDYPEKVLNFVELLNLKDPNQYKIAKHGLRTLLKQGNTEALLLFGYNDSVQVIKASIQLKQRAISIGESLPWVSHIQVQGTGLLRLEYRMHFLRQNGAYSQKVFQIKEAKVGREELIELTRNHSFKNFSTRKHYPGIQKLELIANGKIIANTEIDLKA